MTWLLLSFVVAIPAFGQAEALDPQLQAALREAVTQLELEAKELDDIEDPNPLPIFTRPHKLIAGWDFDKMGPVALKEMGSAFTGNNYRDTYVRWHLMYAVKESLKARFETWKATGKHTVHDATGKRLVALIQKLPAEITLKTKQEWKHVPEDIGNRYHSLNGQTRVRVGIPPFERDYYGEAALQYATGARKAQIEALIAEMKELEPQFKTIYDEKARAYNLRLYALRLLMREYRGDLVYALLQTGDPAMAKLVTSEINRQVRNKQRMGIDMMKYMYLAMADGYMLLYDDNTYKALRNALKATASATDTPAYYLRGEEKPPSWLIPQHHNFGDLAFHMVQILDFPVAMSQFRYGETAEWRKRSIAPASANLNGETLTLEDIHQSVQRALSELYAPRPANKEVLPETGLRAEGELYEALRNGINSPRYQEIVHETGNHALITWAMLAAGETFQNPQLYRRLSFVLSGDLPFTFDRAMRMQMLSNLSPYQWQPWVKRDAIWLERAFDESGAFAYEYGPSGPTDSFNNANSQYGVLGLWAAEKAGIPISKKAWAAIDDHWRKDQHPPDSTGAAGWSIGIIHGDHAIDPETALDFHHRVQGPMTAAGAATLSLTQRYLFGEDLTSAEAQKRVPELRRAIRWLDQNFSMTEIAAGMDWYYYAWTIQRVAQANGIRTLNGIDTFRDVAAEIIKRQGEDGLWTDPANVQGKLMSTGFALLYLTSAQSPVGISKIKFDGNWNNRPQDVWNFVDYASDQYEVPTVWQIVELDLPVTYLMDSPILYLSTDEPFELPDEHITRLREYIDAGGMLLLNPEKASGGLNKSIRDLVTKLYPNRALEDVPRDDPLYLMHAGIKKTVGLKAIHNGVRPLVVQFIRDIGNGLQTDRKGKADGYDALNNLYLYAVGMNPQRIRLDSDYLVDRNSPKPIPISAARLDLGPGSDPEPVAMQQLQRFMADEHAIDVRVDRISPSSLGQHKIAFLSALPGVEINDSDAEAVRKWIEAGGTLWLDAAGGAQSAVEAAYNILQKIQPGGRAIPLAYDSPILTGKGLREGYDNTNVRYRNFLLREMGPANTPRLQTVLFNDRPGVIFSPEDITTGLAGFSHWGIFGYSVDSSRQLVANSILDILK